MITFFCYHPCPHRDSMTVPQECCDSAQQSLRSRGVDLRSTRFSQGPGGHRKNQKWPNVPPRLRSNFLIFIHFWAILS
jgi:hypothetical protein